MSCVLSVYLVPTPPTYSIFKSHSPFSIFFSTFFIIVILAFSTKSKSTRDLGITKTFFPLFEGAVFPVIGVVPVEGVLGVGVEIPGVVVEAVFGGKTFVVT